MRFIFLVLFLSYTSLLNAQLLDAEKPWFDLEGFFHAESIQKHGIKHLWIESQDKKDGESIKKRHDRRDYYFNESGQLIRSEQLLKLSRKVDTTRLYLSYDSQGRLYKKQEKFGFFDFSYFYFYEKEHLAKEIKIDSKHKSADTLYQRYYKFKQDKNHTTLSCYNEAHKLFKTTVFRLEENLKSERLSYTRSGQFIEKQWIYKDKLLSERKLIHFSTRRKEETWHFIYKNGVLEELMQFDQTGKKKIRIALLRNENGLPENLIERNYKEQGVKIHKLNYEFNHQTESDSLLTP